MHTVPVAFSATKCGLFFFQGGILGEGERLQVKAAREGGRFLLLSAKPLGEPVVQHGPFVMNTREEIEQAIRDYQSGRLVAAR